MSCKGHCCPYHGCKYGDPNCPVENGTYIPKKIRHYGFDYYENCYVCSDEARKGIDPLAFEDGSAKLSTDEKEELDRLAGPEPSPSNIVYHTAWQACRDSLKKGFLMAKERYCKR